MQTALLYATYLGGKNGQGQESGQAIAIDKDGNIFVAGTTSSPDFPVTPNGVQTALSPGYSADTACPYNGCDDAIFIAKLAPDGKSVLSATFFGDDFHAGSLRLSNLALDASGNVYIAGTASEGNIPTTASAFQPICISYASCGFAAKLSPDLSTLVYSTYIGGSDVNDAYAMAVDHSGNLILAGTTQSFDFPVTSNAFQPALNPFGCRGLNFGACPDDFVAKLNPSGSGLIFSTFLGGSDEDSVSAIAIDDSDTIYLAGTSRANDFPVTQGAFQSSLKGPYNAFLVKMSTAGEILFSTYLGGSGNPAKRLGDAISSIAVREDGTIYLSGRTGSADFPITFDAVQKNFIGAWRGLPASAFYAKVASDGSYLKYSSYVGGASGDGYGRLLLDPRGVIHIFGDAYSDQFPTKNALQETPPLNCDTCAAGLLFGLSDEDSTLVYSTYLGDRGIWDRVASVGLDKHSDLWVVGTSGRQLVKQGDDWVLGPSGGQFQVTADAYLSNVQNFFFKAFVAKIYAGPQDFELASNAASVEIQAAGKGELDLTIAPQPVFSQSINLSCEAPSGIECEFATAAVTPMDKAQTVHLVIREISSNLPASVLPLLVLVVPFRRKKQQALTCALLGLAATVVLQTGCSGVIARSTSESNVTVNVVAKSASTQHSIPITVILSH